jgi:hypothetical protein
MPSAKWTFTFDMGALWFEHQIKELLSLGRLRAAFSLYCSVRYGYSPTNAQLDEAERWLNENWNKGR